MVVKYLAMKMVIVSLALGEAELIDLGRRCGGWAAVPPGPCFGDSVGTTGSPVASTPSCLP